MARCDHGVDLREPCETCGQVGDVRHFILFPMNLSEAMIVSLAPAIGFRLASEEEIARNDPRIFYLWQ